MTEAKPCLEASIIKDEIGGKIGNFPSKNYTALLFYNVYNWQCCTCVTYRDVYCLRYTNI